MQRNTEIRKKSNPGKFNSGRVVSSLATKEGLQRGTFEMTMACFEFCEKKSSDISLGLLSNFGQTQYLKRDDLIRQKPQYPYLPTRIDFSISTGVQICRALFLFASIILYHITQCTQMVKGEKKSLRSSKTSIVESLRPWCWGNRIWYLTATGKLLKRCCFLYIPYPCPKGSLFFTGKNWLIPWRARSGVARCHPGLWPFGIIAQVIVDIHSRLVVSANSMCHHVPEKQIWLLSYQAFISRPLETWGVVHRQMH